MLRIMNHLRQKKMEDDVQWTGMVESMKNLKREADLTLRSAAILVEFVDHINSLGYCQ